jgi:CheY-like chemotaxis protein
VGRTLEQARPRTRTPADPAACARFEPSRSRADLARTRSQASADSNALTRPVRSLHVLLVDDDPSLRLLCRFNLEASGMTVTEAEDGEAALRSLADELPDVVLLDVMMPRLDGWAVAERLRRDERTRAVPVVFITARAEDDARARGLALGAVGYLVKPFNPATLAEQIADLLAGRAGPETR